MSFIQKVQRNAPATLTAYFYSGETLTDPDANDVDISIVNADGSVHTAATPATRVSTGKYTFTLPAQSALQNLTASWAGLMSAVPVTVTTYVEVVGSFYFDIAELRAYDNVLSNVVKFPTQRLIDVRDEVEAEFESICDRGFVSRFDRQVLTGDGTNELWLENPDITNVTKLLVDGADWAAYISDLRVDVLNSKMVFFRRRSGRVFTEDADVVIEYEYGMKPTPLTIHDKALKRARGLLTSKNARIDERATVINADFGRVNLATPGMDMGFGRYVRSGLGVWHTGIPDIDVALERLRFKDGGAS